MVTIKSHTDLNQSKALEVFLPLESADMQWIDDGLGEPFPFPVEDRVNENEEPCWSLAALLSILPNEISTDDKFECKYQISIRKYDGGDNATFFQIAYGNSRGSSGSWHDMINTGESENLIDCCVQMITWLYTHNFLTPCNGKLEENPNKWRFYTNEEVGLETEEIPIGENG